MPTMPTPPESRATMVFGAVAPPLPGPSRGSAQAAPTAPAHATTQVHDPHQQPTVTGQPAYTGLDTMDFAGDTKVANKQFVDEMTAAMLKSTADDTGFDLDSMTMNDGALPLGLDPTETDIEPEPTSRGFARGPGGAGLADDTFPNSHPPTSVGRAPAPGFVDPRAQTYAGPSGAGMSPANARTYTGPSGVGVAPPDAATFTGQGSGPAGGPGFAPAAGAFAATMAAAPSAAPRPGGFTVVDVTPRGLAMATVAGFCEPIIGKNTRIPHSMKKSFTTSRDRQAEVRLRICQGESRRFDENTALGELVLSNIAPRPRGETTIEVTFAVNLSGILTVTARDLVSGQEQNASLNLVAQLDEAELAEARSRIAGMSRFK